MNRKRVTIYFFAILIVAIMVQGCRHAKTVPAPVVAPQKPTPPAPTETRTPPAVAVRSETPPEAIPDAVTETLIAEKNGWIRDAFFPFDSVVMTPESQENLKATAQWLAGHQMFHVMIEGHCDERGTEEYNLALGQKRAYAAKEYLIDLGIDAQLISTVSYGKERPFDLGHDEAAWAKNRCAHIILTSTSK